MIVVISLTAVPSVLHAVALRRVVCEFPGGCCSKSLRLKWSTRFQRRETWRATSTGMAMATSTGWTKTSARRVMRASRGLPRQLLVELPVPR
jgi:hypothetical protein